MVDRMKVHASEETTMRRKDRAARSATTFAPTTACERYPARELMASVPGSQRLASPAALHPVSLITRQQRSVVRASTTRDCQPHR